MMRSPTYARKKVGNYELGETLGEGTFGKVRKAIHMESGKAFAIKCLDKKQIEHQNMGAQLKREIAVMKMIRSQYIVQFYECLASKSNVYLVLELVTGGELFELLLKERKFSEGKARFFFRQIVEGVQCCHKKGVAHRDLKPENLLLDGNGQLKISDFGLSALHNNVSEGMTLTSSKFLHTTCGSPNYVSPEVIDSEGYDGRKADIWSMGVILYVMSTGCLPFDEKSMPELFAKIRSAKYRSPPPGRISPSLMDLISRILVADPKERISIDDIQKHCWYIGRDGMEVG